MRILPPALRAAWPILLAVCAGALLGLPRAFPHLAPLQIAGFAAFFLLAHGCVRLRDGVKFGALAGLVSAITALAVVHVHLAAAVALLVSLSFNHALFGGILLLLLRHGAFGAFVAGAGVITLGEWGFARLLPIFGTAQYTTCAWSAWPEWVRHEAVLGACGTLLLATLLGACLAGLCLRKDRLRALAGLATLAALGFGLHRMAVASVASQGPTLRVAAAVGDAYLPLVNAERTYAPLVAEAAKQGASWAVLPEMLVVDRDEEDTAKVFGGLARKHHLGLVVGLLEEAPGRTLNKALAIGPDGTRLATHVKAHAIPFMEHYTRLGDPGTPTLAATPEAKLGVFICQDDNFVDPAAANAKAGAQILAVPTLDWPGVETAHFASARHRALETGLPLVRAAHGGIAAIFGPDGAVLARRDHTLEGDGVIVADVPLAVSRTPYAKRVFPDLPVLGLAAGAILAGVGLMALDRRRKKPDAPPDTRSVA